MQNLHNVSTRKWMERNGLCYLIALCCTKPELAKGATQGACNATFQSLCAHHDEFDKVPGSDRGQVDDLLFRRGPGVGGVGEVRISPGSVPPPARHHTTTRPF